MALARGLRFEGKVVLVSGAGSGIGRAAALQLAREGASLFCVDIDAPAAEAVAKEATALGAAALARACDVSSLAQVEAAVGECVAEFGRLDGLCHAAGILHMANTHEHSLEAWKIFREQAAPVDGQARPTHADVRELCGAPEPRDGEQIAWRRDRPERPHGHLLTGCSRRWGRR